jgi:HK97 family phage portal protein
MAWNPSTNKSLNNQAQKDVGPGAPVAQNPGYAGKPYRDSWDIERAYREGMQKVTWVSRCIDAIAGNQARLPIQLRKDNSPHGEILSIRESKKMDLMTILNSKSNIGENSYIFRYRLSAQLLLGTRGAFIEKVRGRDGGIIGLNLLPPQSTSPIPDPKKFVSGYEVQMPTGNKIYLKPEDVCWVRRPHPIDPYLSLTPLEACGVAIEIENLAKLYNRNYLLNDGRPGGLLVLRGEIDDDDKEELRSRFRGNLSRAGYTSVIASDEGVDYVDTSANPRDAAYIQMRQLTKEEILASFGVPESVIGNAAGRTFSNASEEIRVFWMETMLPHLEILSRGLDELDDENYVDFNVDQVPILMLYEQERHRYLMDEFNAGLISNNEYRIGSGRKETESDLADSLLANPNLIPIANTKKKMEEPSQAQVPGAPGQPGMPGMPPGAPAMPGMPPMPPGAEGQPPLDPNTMAGAIAEVGGAQPGGELAQSPIPGMPPGMMTGAEPVPAGATSAESSELMTKDALESQVTQNQEIERWEEILVRSMERVLERQQRVVLEKSSGAKAKKALFAGTLDIPSVLHTETWDRQFDEDIKPVVTAIVKESLKASLPTEKKSAKSWEVESDVIAQVESQMARIKSINQDLTDEITSLMLSSLNVADEDQRAGAFRSNIVSLYTNVLAKRIPEVASEEARRAWTYGKYIAR